MQISVMIDGIILLVVLFSAWFGWRKGLFRTLAELAAVLLALLLAAQIAAYAAPMVVDRTLRPAAHTAIEERVDQLARENHLAANPADDLPRVIASIPNRYVREIAKAIMADLDPIRDLALTSGRDALLNAARQVVDMALDTVVLQAVHTVLCALAFMVLLALLRLVIRLLDTVLKLPVPFVHTFNEAGGMLLGLLKGIVLVCVGVWLLSRLGLLLTPEVLEETRVAGFIAGLLGMEAPVSL